MNLQTYLTPWTMGSAVASLILSMGTIIVLIINRRHVGAALKKAVASLFSQIGFFSVVIIIFMMISVLESGEFFNSNITHGAIFGLLGYALALGFDLVSIVCMLARLNAQRMRDEHGSRLNLVGVMICAAVSAFANAAGSLQGYDPADLSHTPAWMQVSAPWLGMVFPALIVVLSMTTDHILDHAPSRGIDVATFRERERKRVDMLQVRLDTERELLKLETELTTLRHNQEQASGRVRREWIFLRWLRPVSPVSSNAAGDGFKVEIDQAVQALRSTLEERLEDLGITMRTLDTQVKTWTTQMDQRLDTLRTQMGQVQDQVRIQSTLDLDHDPVTGPGGHPGPGMSHAHRARGEQGATVGSERMQAAEEQDRPATSRVEAEELGNVAERILAALLRLGANAPDTWIAREVGCSRKTVARWRKRFQAQGKLPVAAAQNQEHMQITEAPEISPRPP